MKPNEFSICAGPFATVAEHELATKGGPLSLRLACRDTLASAPGYERVSSAVAKALVFYEDMLGVACPCDKYEVVFAPDLQPLAAQVPGMMLINESMLSRLGNAGDDFVELVLAHEVSHLWFGCIVEGRWWDDLWLAEALATYACHVAGEEAFRMASPWAEFAFQDKARALRADTLPTARAVASPVTTAADALARPTALTYSKGASVIRQLAALVGEEALRSGLHEYLTAFAGGAATLGDLMECWSKASGRDLTTWAEKWLRTAGANTLRPACTLAPDRTIESFHVLQEPPTPSGGVPQPDGVLRTHRVEIGLYDLDGSRLRRRCLVSAEIDGARRLVPELSGSAAPDAIVVNDGDLSYASLRFDEISWQALSACAMDLGDPLTEAACWNAACEMTTSAEIGVGELAGLVGRRAVSGAVPAAVAGLLERVVHIVDSYASGAERPKLREDLAARLLEGALKQHPGSRQMRSLAIGAAASAESRPQLELLRSWLNGSSLFDGLTLDLELRAAILATLSRHDLTDDSDLEAFAADDPVGGEANTATCSALRPDAVAKQRAWEAALSEDQPPRMALAHAAGIFVPGQEEVVGRMRDRYFSEAIPRISVRDSRTSQRLARLLFPATLANLATLAATEAALADDTVRGLVRAVVLEQRAIMNEVLRAIARTESA